MGTYKVYANYPKYADEFIIGKEVDATSPADAALKRVTERMGPADQKDVCRVLVIGNTGVSSLDNPRVFDVERVAQPTFAVTPA